MSDRTEALFQKAMAAHRAGRLVEASALCASVLRMRPLHFGALHLAGSVAYQSERMEEAVCLLSRAARVCPKSGWTLLCLGHAQAALGRLPEAEKALRAGVALDPRNPLAHHMLGAFLGKFGKKGEAMECYREALKLKPDSAETMAAIAILFVSEGLPTKAVAASSLALRNDPKNLAARQCLVQSLQACNRVEESLRECDKLIELAPSLLQARSNRLFLLNYADAVTRESLFAEHLAFGNMLPPAPARRFTNSADPERRIRIGFLSPDLRTHSVASFIEPLVAHLDPEHFEVVLYHDHERVDAVSERFRARASLWRNLSGRPDAVAEAIIRSDAPDVMVDLAGHTGQNRLRIFSRRLAPVQITYLGYPNTTGVAAMDYRFTDAVADPEGAADELHVERLVRFARCGWAYQPPADLESAGIPGPSDPSVVTFGSFNNLCKVNTFTLRLWGSVLAAVPGSRLVLKALQLDPKIVGPRLVAAGIDPGRVSLVPPANSFAGHIAAYGMMDVALDSFPYGGTTTTCEALWMGRPVVTLCGDRHASRVGSSILSAIGREKWIAQSPADFVRIASALASDRALLDAERSSLRAALMASLLLDHEAQARSFGEGVRGCWKTWCVSGEGHAIDTFGTEAPRELAVAQA